MAWIFYLRKVGDPTHLPAVNPDIDCVLSRLVEGSRKRILAMDEAMMSNPEYIAVLAALDQARIRLEADWVNLDEGALRIRALINLALKASQAAVFSTVALLDTVALLERPHAADVEEGTVADLLPASPSSSR